MTKGIQLLRHRIRPALLRWAVSVFCVLTGALMLIAPHQFAGPSFAVLRPWLTEWGAAFVAAGVGLITTSATGMRGPFATAANVTAGLALLTLAVCLLLSGAWTGVAIYATFGAATLLSPLFDQSSAPGDESIDLFVLTAAVAAVAIGIVLMPMAGPALDTSPGLIQTVFSSYATLFAIGGLSALIARLWSRPSGLARGVTQIVLGVAYLGWFAWNALPNRSWSGMLAYGGTGALLLLGPHIARYVRHVDPSSLRVRLALAMASSAAIPLLLVAAVATGWQEQAAVDQQLALQQALASGLAADVDGALTQHLVGLVLVAEHPMVLASARSSSGPLLGDVGDVAPGLVALGTFDSAGRPSVVLGGDNADTQTRLSALANEALGRTAPGVMPPGVFLSSDRRPSVVLTAPIRQADRGLGGIAVGELDRSWLQRRLERGIADARLSAVVVDDTGQIVVAAGDPIAGESNLAGHPSVRALDDEATARGRVRFGFRSGEYLAGFARIPETDWAVIVQQPTSTALASVWASRELTFGVLLGAFVVAAALGVALANRLAAPLALLARAAQSIAVGGPTSAIPRSRLYEVRVVARAFAQMQSRLAARTSERERAETRLQTLADASGDLTRSLDESEIITALGAIVVGRFADWCTIDTVDAHGDIARALVLHHEPARQSLAAAIRELPPLLGSELARPALAGEPVLMSVVTPRQIAGLAETGEHRRALEWLGIRSLIIVPLRIRDQTLGALTCVYGRGGRRYGADDLPLAQELALRAALALDHARLYAAERAARADAEAAVRVRDEFLAIAAHELKTPVTSLRGFAELGVRTIDAHGTLDTTMARRTLETIERQSARLTALVANLLEFARGSADRNAIAPRRVNLADLARIVVEAARVRADQYTISLDAPDTIDVMADPLRIEQVLSNLVDNAVKYSPVGSEIQVQVREQSQYAELVVRDHGMGIPAEDQHRVFDRYFQARVGEHSSGMGLGLYISQEIVRHHGGTIAVETPEDGGTRMVVRLPREPATEAPTREGQLSA
jgi:signal transduction histidine kinase/HAMP domain-containing protein